MTFAETVDELLALPGVQEAPEEGASWRLLVSTGNAEVEVIIPFSTLEWYATARTQEGRVLWSDWMDYQGYDRTHSLDRLERDMCGDIKWFVETLTQATSFRAGTKGALVPVETIPEVNIGGEWKQLKMYHQTALSK